MNYSLDAYTQPLTTAQAAHLLRRTTFGPTQNHISAFTGVSSGLAIDTLINNINYTPAPPVDLNVTLIPNPTIGQPYIGTLYNNSRNPDFKNYTRNWWIGLMAAQNNNPSLAEKLTMFWQNHFVTEIPDVDEYRATYQYFNLIRTSILGNFKDLVYNITKDPAMLKYLNGHDNEKNRPNENYARELQELFVVGEKDFAGNNNYTENDVKAAARVLTGWRYDKFKDANTTAVFSKFELPRHDTNNKQFSTKYPDPVNPTLGTVITGRATNPIGTTAGDLELDDLLTMLFRHPETPKFICRKLYRFFVNPNVTQAVEDNVIIPLANLFKSQDPTTNRTFEIKPIIKKLLMSEHFYDEENIGSIVKSPAELVIGTLQFLGFSTPPLAGSNLNNITTYKRYTDYIYDRMNEMQMSILAQPSVFGYDAYYQPGYSRNWINASMIGLRNGFEDSMITGKLPPPNNGNIIFTGSGVTPIYTPKIDFMAWVDKPSTPAPNYYDASDCASIVDLLTKNLFATGLNASQKNFLIDTIFMQNEARNIWTTQWNLYKTATPANLTTRTNTVRVKMENVMKFLFRMAEYQIF